VIRALSLGAIAVAAFLGVASVAGRPLMPYLHARSMLTAKVDWALRFPDTNLIAIGPSYVEMGFDPDVFDASLKAKGKEVHSFNLGIDGLSVPEMRTIAEALVEKKACCIRYALVSPCFECLHVGQIPDSARSVSYFDARRGIGFLRYVWLYEQLPDQTVGRADYARNVGSAVFRHHTSLGVAANRLGFAKFEGQTSPDLTSASYWARRPRGFEPVDHVMSGDDARRYESGLDAFAKTRAAELERLSAGSGGDAGARLVSDPMFEGFLELVRYLRSRSIAVLVVTPPNERQWQFHAAFIARLRRCCARDIPLADFGDASRWRELFVPASIRYDDEHMNADGAAIWSRALAERTAEWMNDLH
jgi:hypothetical protein